MNHKKAQKAQNFFFVPFVPLCGKKILEVNDGCAF